MELNLDVTIDSALNAAAGTADLTPLPPDVTDAVDLYNAVRGYQVPEPAIDRPITVRDLPAIIEGYAAARRDKQPLVVVKEEVREITGRRLIGVVIGNADAILASLVDGFTHAAQRFTAAFRALPADWADAARLVQHGPDVVARFGEAQAATGELDRYRAVKSALTALGATPAAGALVAGTTYTRVPDTMVAEQVTAAQAGTLGHWGAWLSIPDVELTWWASVAEHRAYVDSLPRAEIRYRRNSIGHEPYKHVVTAPQAELDAIDARMPKSGRAVRVQ